MHLRATCMLIAAAFLLHPRERTVDPPAQAIRASRTESQNGPRLDGTVTLPNFRFGTGEILPQLRLHYITLGTPHRNATGHADNAVLLLHGHRRECTFTMNPLFFDVLFGPGSVLDITKYFLILPDDIGHGQSSRPSRRAAHAFPRLRLRRHGAQPAP